MSRGYYKQAPVTISVNEAADLLGVGGMTIRRLIERGEIASITLVGRVLVVRSEIDRLLAEAMEQQTARRAAEAQLAEARAILRSLPEKRRQRRAAGQ